LKRKLETLKKLNMDLCIVGYSDVLPLNIVSSETFARHELPPVFYTGDSLIDGCAGFAFHRNGEGGFGYNISSPAGIFIAELTALFVT
jgi:hypothetical protein